MTNIKRALKDGISGCVFICRKHFRAQRENRKTCRILMYHAIEDIDRNVDVLGLAVPPKTFRMHMQILKEKEFRVVDLSELTERIASNNRIPDNSIVITFDDGYKNILTEALPILKEFGFPATLFVNLYFIERKIPKSAYWHRWQTLNWEEIRKLSEAGFSIGSHAVTHRKLTELDGKGLKEEITTSKETIERNIGQRVTAFSYPHGGFNPKIKNILKDNDFRSASSSIEGTNDISADMFALKRTEITAFDNTPLKYEKKIRGGYDWLGWIKR